MKKLVVKIIRNLFYIHKVPQKIFFLIKNYFLLKSYDQDKYLLEQEILFSSIGLNRENGKKRLSQIQNEYPFIIKEMSSEHQTLFASISFNKKFKKILEIGTYDGTNAFLLSQLFPDSKIITIDLDDEDRSFVNSYEREKTASDFCKNRDEVLSKSNNIIFRKTNSLNLSFNNEKFDLIWIDGAHGYPVVTSDIVNSIRLLNTDGIIMCDDIWKSIPRNQDSMYSSIASYETLSHLSDANIIDYSLFFKRLTRKHNYIKENIKYVAYLKLRKRN